MMETDPETANARFEHAGQALWSALLAAAMDAIIAMDHEGRIVEFNTAAEQMFGYTRAEVVGETMADIIVPPALREAHRKGLARYVETGEARILGKRLELTALRRDGTEFPVELTVTRVALPGPPLFAGQVRDISTRLEAAAKLEQQVHQREAVAEIGRQAIAAPGLASLATPAAELIADAVVGSAAVYRVEPGHDSELLATAGVVTPDAHLGGDGRPPEAPVTTTGRRAHEIAVPIRGAEGTYGVVAARVPYDGPATEAVEFVESMANVLAAASDRARALAELRMSRDQLDVIFRNVDDAITVQGPNGQILYANDAAAELMGFASAHELLDTPVPEILDRFEMMDEHRQPLDPMRLPGRVVFEGAQRSEMTVLYRVVATGEERWSRVRASPVVDETGAPRLAINIVEDVTDAHRAEMQTRLFAEVADILGSSLDFEETLRKVADVVVPEFADWCSLDLVQDDGSLRCLAVAHSDPARASLIQEFRERRPYRLHDDVPLARVAASGEPELTPDIPDELLEAATDDPAELEMLRSLGFRSSLVVPLSTRSRVLGTIAMAHAESGRQFGAHDVPMLQELARRAAVAVDNARLYSERDYIAETLEQSLLPPFLPDVPGFEVGAVYQSARAGTDVGGDFYDVFRFDERRWAAVLGDVQGKGVEAAALVGVARHTLRAAALAQTRPEPVLELLNKALLAHPTHRLCTVAFALLERSGTGAHAVVAAAGHPPPLVKRASGAVEVIPSRGTVLGCFADVELDIAQLSLAPGDTLLLYSDGVGGRGALMPDAVVDLAASAPHESATGFVGAIEAALTELLAAGLDDDVTMLALRLA